MANMRPPTFPRLLPLILPILYCHCLGYYISKGIFKFEPNLSEENLKYVTTVSTNAEIISLILGAIIVESFAEKYYFVLRLTFIWIFVFTFFYITRTNFMAGLVFGILFGFVFSTLKIAILSYGASEYEPRYSSELFVYFLLCYGAIVFSELTSIYLIPPNPDLCLNMDCASSSMLSLIIGTCAVISFSLFFLTKYIYTVTSKSTGIRFSPILPFIWKISKIMIFVTVMFGLWIAKEQIIIRWSIQAESTTQQILSYIVDRSYLKTIYLFCSALFIVIFYVCFYDKFEKCLHTNPIYAIIIGCLLTSITIISSIKLEITTLQNNSRLPKENHTFFFMGTTAERETIVVFTYFTGESYSIKPNSYLFITFPMNESEKYIPVYFDYPVLELDEAINAPLFRPKWLVDFSRCRNYRPIQPDGGYGPNDYYQIELRDEFYNRTHTYEFVMKTPLGRGVGPIAPHKSQLPMVCVTCTHFSFYFEQHFTVLYKLNHATQNGPLDIQYHFLCSYLPIGLNSCQPVVPGTYKVRDGLITSPTCSNVLQFEMGGFYYIQTFLEGTVSRILMITLIEPCEISFGWLLPPIILVSIGESLIMIAGLYYVYTQGHAKLRTISLGIWMFTASSGVLVNNIFNGIGKLNAIHIFVVAGGIFIGTAIILVILNVFVLNFDEDWESAAEVDTVDEPGRKRKAENVKAVKETAAQELP